MNHLRNIAPTFSRTLACATMLLVMNLSAFAAEPVRPAFEASSDMFELVGRIKDSRLSLTLDRWATNEPVSGARIEIDLNGRAFVAEAQADGSYAIDAAPFATPTTYPLTITVTAGDESDLLAADFVVASEAPGASPFAAGTTTVSGIGLAALFALVAAAAVTILRRRKGAPQ